MVKKEYLSILQGFLLCIAYLLVQFIFSDRLAIFSAYFSYYFDLAFVVLVWLIYFRSLNIDFKKIMSKISFVLCLFIFPGAVIHLMALKLHLLIPFDLTSKETILFLLVIGPLLEEFVFRFAFWEIFSKLSTNQYFPLIVTSILFSLAHFYSYWFVPNEIRSFVIFQTLYTLFLGFACGYFRQKYSSVTFAIVTHFAFNLGFYGVIFL